MDGEDRLEQRATPSRLTARWDRVCTLFEQAPDALFLLDPEGEAIPDVDRPACRLLAYSAEDLLPLPLHAIRPNQMPRFRAFTRVVLQAAQAGGSRTSPA